MKKVLFLIIFCLVSFLTAEARETPDSLWNEANAYYAREQYQDALDHYMKIENSGVESADLYYNIGNTYFKMRYMAYAVLYYEKALRLAPNDPDIAYNLGIAREQCIDRIEPVPTFFVADWIRKSHQIMSQIRAIVSVCYITGYPVLLILVRLCQVSAKCFHPVRYHFSLQHDNRACSIQKQATRKDIALYWLWCPVKRLRIHKGKICW